MVGPASSQVDLSELDQLAGPIPTTRVPVGGAARILRMAREASGTQLARKRSAPVIPGLTWCYCGGRYWDRTSDLFGVNEALSP